jgi:Flp pilus assembly protein protease CpaA
MSPNVVLLSFALVKIVKSTHRHPINRMLHVGGLLLYAYGFCILITPVMGEHDFRLVTSLAMWFTAIDLFIVGHVIEGNVGAMTLTMLFKYIRFKLSTKRSRRPISYAS